MLCGACGEKYASRSFWICCDMNKEWFDGKIILVITHARVIDIE